MFIVLYIPPYPLPLFPHQVLDIITQPYTTKFIQLFAPLVESDDITGNLRLENKNDPVSDFLCKYNLCRN